MADLMAENHGSIALVTPCTDLGRKWLQDHTSTEGWQWLGPSLAVEPRYILPLLEGAILDGLTIGEGRC